MDSKSEDRQNLEPNSSGIRTAAKSNGQNDLVDQLSDLRAVPTLVLWPTELKWQLRLKFFLTGALFPIICLTYIGFGASSSIDSPWQSGAFEDYVIVLASSPTIFVFGPLLLFSFVCLVRWCVWPHKSNSFLNWLGLLTGAILALTFAVLLVVTTFIVGPIMALCVAPSLALLVFLVDLSVKKKWLRSRFSIKYLLVWTTLIALGFGLTTALGGDPLAPVYSVFGFLAVCFLFVMGAAPTLGFITFCRVTFASGYLIWQDNDQPVFGLKSMAIVVAWIAAFVATWKYAIDLMMLEYAKLPTTDPNCYVSSAAGCGHPEFVGAFEVPGLNTADLGDGSDVQVEGQVATINKQMQRLKFLEFAFAALLPGSHRVVRKLYNRVGPQLAKVCRSSIWISDLTYVLLKPFEWTAVWVRRITGVSEQRVNRIYRS